MKFTALTLSALLSIATADIGANLDSVVLYASTMSALISKFQTADGLPLEAQQSFYPLKSAVNSLSSSLQAADKTVITDTIVTKISSLESAVANLMEVLATRAADLTQVGANGIVKGDITDLYTPSLGIASKLVGLAEGNCAALSSVAPGLSSMDAGFSKNAPLYSYSVTAFPTIPVCVVSSEAVSSAASSATSAETSPSAVSTEAASSASETSSSAVSTEAAPSAPEASSSASTEAVPSTTSTEASSTSKVTSSSAIASSSVTKRCIVHPTSGAAYTSTYLA